MPAKVNYFEIGSADPDAARSFYGSLFDWSFGEPSPEGYRMVNDDQGRTTPTALRAGERTSLRAALNSDHATATRRPGRQAGRTIACAPAAASSSISRSTTVGPPAARPVGRGTASGCPGWWRCWCSAGRGGNRGGTRRRALGLVRVAHRGG